MLDGLRAARFCLHQQPPAPYALARAPYRPTLEGDEYLLLDGHVVTAGHLGVCQVVKRPA